MLMSRRVECDILWLLCVWPVGMAHLLSLPVGEAGCCGVVEMTVEGFHQLHQFGNQARHLGLPFFR